MVIRLIYKLYINMLQWLQLVTEFGTREQQK